MIKTDRYGEAATAEVLPKLRASERPRPKPADDFDLSVTMQPDGYFCAINRNNYDVDCDHTGFFTKSPHGYGRTPLDAIVDLLDNAAEG